MATILVTRPQPQASHTAQWLHDAGHTPLLCPALSLHTMQDAAQHVEQIAQADAVILTSQAALRALHTLGLTRSIPLYVTGKATAGLAQQHGFEQVCAAQDNVASLQTLLLQQDRNKSYAYVRGERISYDLCASLRTQGIQVNEYIIYCAKPSHSLPDSVISHLNQRRVDAVLFYSMFSLQSFVQLVAQSGCINALQHIHAICISNSIMKAAQEITWRSCRSTASPAAKDILSTLVCALD